MVYLTFGQSHRHTVNGIVFDKDCVAVFETDDDTAARKHAMKLFGRLWFTTYSEESWKAYTSRDGNKTEFMRSWFPRGYIYIEEALYPDE